MFAGKMLVEIFMCGNLFLQIAGRIAKIRTLKNFVPHGSKFQDIAQRMGCNEVVSDNQLISLLVRYFAAHAK